ncbi:MAG: GntR family transcriptional regulator [Erysipelotrichaceae bacterium]|nr:GntR family transcriptional regulator [Erysipelotrichaceae bacterium]MDP3305407.1 GntR family transcriptional regulator [Erysipelotrichaceae bacterium]
MLEIQQTSIRDQVALKLRHEIFTGQLAIGEQIRQETIATRYQVSRMPIREAFFMLEAEGFISILPNKRVLVLGMSKKTLTDHFDTRILIETEITLQASRKCTDYKTMQNILGQSESLDESIDRHRYSRLNDEFHREIWRLADNAALQSTCAYLWRGITSLTLLYFSEAMQRSIDDHKKLLEAMNARDEIKIIELVSEHIISSRDAIIEHFDKLYNGISL